MSRITRNEHIDSEELSQKQQIAIFSQLLGRQWNKLCADCSTRSPTWASIDFGAFICIDCAGAHRALGPTITRVRSTNLDIWKKSWIHQMVLGNDKVNQYWEGDLAGEKKINLKLKSNATRAERERWALVKFVRKKYVSEVRKDPMIELKSKIQDQKKLKMTLIEKIRSLQEIRNHEIYVENHYSRVIEAQDTPQKSNPASNQKIKSNKRFDFFEDQEDSIIKDPPKDEQQNKIKVENPHFENVNVNFNFNFNVNPISIFTLGSSIPIEKSAFFTYPTCIPALQAIKSSHPLPTIPPNLSFFTSYVSTPSHNTGPSSPIASNQYQNIQPKQFLSPQFQLVSFNEHFQKKSFAPINILSQNSYSTNYSYSYDIDFNTPAKSFNHINAVEQQSNQKNKYESFNQFNW